MNSPFPITLLVSFALLETLMAFLFSTSWTSGGLREAEMTTAAMIWIKGFRVMATDNK